ncbi:Na+/H+ antiporter NhaC [Pseudemcibacter aquimaris]|uniref:Na+/H+ antiporter NhaC n=1 Tax=Pseudemcibacter aquimaris TaxID=2857064 RepID=UPI002011E007|nr:Na+/H+ antiporter NhaC [Pseudemcibacter aquimaris]MCC3859735.1 Na+/H+ antiporter NhaC [Pseudemcibacter aquimaris]WDU60129.1 Na+/H+ antiporter NhaC [Pseudemcibacter aquimaris]
MTDHKLPSFWHSLVCFGGILVLIVTGVVVYRISIQVLLLLSITWASIHTMLLGYKFSEVKNIMSDGISKALGAVYIFILIGVVVASFLASGTITTLVYYGLDFIHPAVFLPVGLILCSFMSVSVGTMVGTVATVGVILIGIGAAMGVPLPIVAGMVIAGASFGDKMSPVSDTTNMAAVATGTDLFTHIKSMLYTTVPTFVICLILFSFIGMEYAGQALDTAGIDNFKAAIADNFEVSILGFVPLIILFGMSYKKIPAEPSMMTASFVAILLALFQQGQDLLSLLSSLHGGYSAETGNADLDRLVNRGGIMGMMGTLLIALFAMALAGILDNAGYIRAMLEGILKHLKNVLSLIAATMLTGIVASIATGQSYISIVLTAQLFRDKFDKMGLKKRMLSRTIEESTTLTTPLLPWSLGGAFYSGALGVAVFDYAPWAFLNYLNVVVALIMTAMGLAIFRKEKIADQETAK